MILGFTGTQDGMTQKQKEEFVALLSKYSVDEFHHGDCVGSDFEAACFVRKNEKVIIYSHPPINEYKRAFFKSDIILPKKDFLVRNKDIVNACDILIATPKEMEEVLRSGTWSTIRYAKKLEKEFIVLFPK